MKRDKVYLAGPSASAAGCQNLFQTRREKCKREGRAESSSSKFAIIPSHSKVLMFYGGLPVCRVNTGKIEGHKVEDLIYLEGCLVSHFRLRQRPVFLQGREPYMYTYLCCLQVEFNSGVPRPHCDTPYEAAWPAKQPWKDFLFNLPFKETGWYTPKITRGQPYNMELGAEWNSGGKSQQAQARPSPPQPGVLQTLF